MFTISSLVGQAQLHGNPGGGGPGKGNEEYNLCHDLKITLVEHIKDLLKLEKKEYLSDEDFYKYLDNEIVAIAIKQWSIFDTLNIKKDDTNKLLPCGQTEKKEPKIEKTEKLDLLIKIRWTIKKSQIGHKTCSDLFNRYYYHLNQLDTIIKYYENQDK